MSNCYSHYYAMIPFFNQEQLEWLLHEIKEPDEIQKARNEGPLWGIWGGDPDDEWDFPIYTTEWNEEPFGGHLCFEGEQSPHHIVFLVIVYAQKFNLFHNHPWSLETALTSDRPRYENDFGGSGYAIYKGQSFYINTNTAIAEWLEERDQNDEDFAKTIKAWERAFQE